MFKGYFFDLDGVVFNSEPHYSEFWGSVGKTYLPDMADFSLRIKGQTLVEIYDRFFNGPLKAERARITEALNAFERKMPYEYIPGFECFIQSLRKENVRTAVVTSSNQAKMRNVYRQHPEFASLFDAILTSEDFSRSKPDPEGYLVAAERFGLKPEDCVGFEDSVNGLRSVRSAGMTVVGLATTNALDVVRPLCDVAIKDFTELRSAANIGPRK